MPETPPPEPRSDAVRLALFVFLLLVAFALGRELNEGDGGIHLSQLPAFGLMGASGLFLTLFLEERRKGERIEVRVHWGGLGGGVGGWEASPALVTLVATIVFAALAVGWWGRAPGVAEEDAAPGGSFAAPSP